MLKSHQHLPATEKSGVWSWSSPESGFWPGVGVSLLKETPTPGAICLIWTLGSFIAVCLTFVQCILQLKLCLYTTLHFLLEGLKIHLKSSLSTQSLCHIINPRVGVGV